MTSGQRLALDRVEVIGSRGVAEDRLAGSRPPKRQTSVTRSRRDTRWHPTYRAVGKIKLPDRRESGASSWG